MAAVPSTGQITAPRLLTRRYVVALSLIALIALATQLLVQVSLSRQTDDSREINIAGRQRMLSQRLTKNVLALSFPNDVLTHEQRLDQLQQTLDLWVTSHIGLQEGDAELGLVGDNSATVQELYASIEDNHEAMVTGATCILALERGQEAPECTESVDQYTTQILENEADFLTGMDAIVFQYDDESSAALNSIRLLEILLFVVLLVTLIGEVFLVFRPAIAQVAKAFDSLQARQRRLEAASADYRLIAENIPELIWRQTPHGIVTYVSPSVTEVLGAQPQELIGHAIHSRYHESDYDRLVKADTAVN
ncbi:MAG: type IV pili methyl-accepting chemotaxis transducer N-terminal domain-containing protein, partial [Anaerolineae bacterium]|nr:type IV pili methyl-accepting chemotaxis transducer N-terminal domain-containing protein [Anaerolineae bacterium]